MFSCSLWVCIKQKVSVPYLENNIIDCSIKWVILNNQQNIIFWLWYWKLWHEWITFVLSEQKILTHIFPKVKCNTVLYTYCHIQKNTHYKTCSQENMKHRENISSTYYIVWPNSANNKNIQLILIYKDTFYEKHHNVYVAKNRGINETNTMCYWLHTCTYKNERPNKLDFLVSDREETIFSYIFIQLLYQMCKI